MADVSRNGAPRDLDLSAQQSSTGLRSSTGLKRNGAPLDLDLSITHERWGRRVPAIRLFVLALLFNVANSNCRKCPRMSLSRRHPFNLVP